MQKGGVIRDIRDGFPHFTVTCYTNHLKNRKPLTPPNETNPNSAHAALAPDHHRRESVATTP